MACASCGRLNRPGRRYCGGCGAAIGWSCPGCAFVNDQGDLFCGGCGARPHGSEAPRRDDAPGELRPVFVLFADLAGYTRLSGNLHPEAVHAMLARLFEVLDGTVAEHGGRVDKHIGDNVMAVFGAPIAHGDDAARAVRAALAMHERIEPLGRSLGVALRLHIGIAGGQVMASRLGSAHHDEYTVIGNTVNLAARLQDRAQAGETLIDDAVHRAVRPLVQAELVPPLVLKNVEGPVRAFLVHGMADQAQASAAFVGRAPELERIEAAARACLQHGSGAVLVVRGEPGLGKTRLAQTARERALGLGLSSVSGVFAEQGGVGTSAGLASALRELLELPADAEASLAALHAVAGSQHAPFLADVLAVDRGPSVVAHLAALDDATLTRGKLDAIGALIAAATRARPRLLVLEDVQWANVEDARLLGALARACARNAAVLLLTARPEAQLSFLGAQLETIELGPLAPEHAAVLATSLGAEAALALQAAQRAGGNPLFLEQLVSWASEGLDEGALPANVHNLVQARIDRLPADARGALQVASVLGQRFEPAALSAVAAGAFTGLGELLHRSLLVHDGDALAFRHALIREGVYASLTLARKRELHRAAADALGDGAPAERARHLREAGDARAASAYLHAARQAGAGLHHAIALELLEQGVACAAGAVVPGERALLYVEQGRTLLLLGRAREAAQSFGRALEAADSDALRCEAEVALGAAHRALSEYDRALAALERAEPLATTLGLDAALAELLYHRAAILFACSDLAGCESAVASAVAAAERIGSAAWRARAKSTLADLAFFRGELCAARDAFAEACDLAESAGLLRYALPNRIMLGQTSVWLGEIAFAERAHERAFADALHLQDRFAEMFARHSLCFLACEIGAHEVALARALEARELARTLGARRFEYEVQGQVAEALLRLGRRAEALPEARGAVALGREVGLAYCGPYVLGVLSLVTDDAAERAAALAEAEALLAAGSMCFNHLLFLRCAMDATLAAGELELAQGFAQRLRALGRQTAAVVAELHAERGEQELERLRHGQSVSLATRGAALLQRAAEVGIDVRLPASPVA